MSYYYSHPLNEAEMAAETGAKYKGLGAGESHEEDIQRAGGERGYDGFQDPRPNEEGKMVADRFFINEKTNEIQGINFNKDGKFCCSYKGYDYKDIKDYNKRDCDSKQQSMAKGNNSHTDEFGISKAENKNQCKSGQDLGVKK